MNNNNQETINNIRNIKLQEYFKFLDGLEDYIEFEKSHLSSKDYLISQQILNDKIFYNNIEKK